MSMGTDTASPVAVVVGGAGGIGSAIVRRFAADGLRVAVGDEDVEQGERLAVELGDAVDFFPVDVLDEESIDRFAAQLGSAYGTLDHLVSLAGGSLEGEHEGLKAVTPELIHRCVDLNLKSHMLLVRALQAWLRAGRVRDRSITFVSSINAIKDYGLPVYSAAKAGLLGLAYPLATELGLEQIRVNVLLPGTVLTPRTAHLPRRLDDSRENGTALRRFSTADEIAQVAWALARVMTCVTGQAVVADCGQSMRGYPLYRTPGPDGD